MQLCPPTMNELLRFDGIKGGLMTSSKLDKNHKLWVNSKYKINESKVLFFKYWKHDQRNEKQQQRQINI